MGGGGWQYLINPSLPDSDQLSADKIPCPHVFVKLRPRSGEGHNSKDKIYLSLSLMQAKLVKLPFCFGRACLYT